MNLNLVSEKEWRIVTIEQLMRAAELDEQEWEILKAKVNKREVAMNKKDWSTELTELFQVVAELRLKSELLWADNKQVLFDVFWSSIPEFVFKSRKDWPLLWQIVHTDLHIDRLEHAKKNYLKEIDDRTMRLFERLLKHKPDALVYANLGDYFNSDTNGKTTKWTDQKNYLSDRDSFKLWLEHQVRLIKTLASEIPVEAIYIPWNHDRTKLQALSDAVDLYFSKSNVWVDSTNSDRKYRKWWNTTLWYAHWDWIKNKQIPLTMQQETNLWKHNYFYKGHLHHKHVEQLWTVSIQQLWSPAYPSEREINLWHSWRWKIEWQIFDKKDWKIAEFWV